MQKYNDVVLDVKGNVVPTASITVTDTNGNPVTIYNANSTGSPKTQPFTPNSLGEFSFYAPDGRYNIVVTYSGITYTISDVLFDDPTTSLSGSTGSSEVGFIQAGTAAIARTVQSKERDIVSVKDFGAVGDGVANDTTAFSSALAAANGIYIPDGTYLVDTVALIANTTADQGKRLFGQSRKHTIIKARTSTTTKILDVEGIVIQAIGHVCENFTIDMTNMTDVATSYGIYTKNGWDCTFRDIDVIGYGVNKYSHYSDTGFYTSLFQNCDFGSTVGKIKHLGVSLGNAVTTLTYLSCSFGSYTGSYCVGITFLSPTVQGALNKFSIDNCNGVSIYGGEIEGSGIYLNIGANVQHLSSINTELSGFSGTYSSGTFNGGVLMDQFGSTPFTLSPVNGVTVNGVVTEQNSAASLTRNVIKNTNVTSQQVDTQFNNANGSTYVGQNATADSYINNIGSGKVIIQQSSVDRLGVDSIARIIVGTQSQTTVGAAGGASALPATPTGYLRIIKGGVDYVIPYYAQA